MAIKIVIMSYKELTTIIQQLNYRPPAGVTIQIVDALMDEALLAAKSIEEKGEADVFVSAGANLATLGPHLTLPIVGIEVTGFDFLTALSKARRYSRIAFVTFRKKITYIDSILGVLAVKVRQIIYHDIKELDELLDDLAKQNITTVIGSSLVSVKPYPPSKHLLAMR